MGTFVMLRLGMKWVKTISLPWDMLRNMVNFMFILNLCIGHDDNLHAVSETQIV